MKFGVITVSPTQVNSQQSILVQYWLEHVNLALCGLLVREQVLPM